MIESDEWTNLSDYDINTSSFKSPCKNSFSTSNYWMLQLFVIERDKNTWMVIGFTTSLKVSLKSIIGYMWKPLATISYKTSPVKINCAIYLLFNLEDPFVPYLVNIGPWRNQGQCAIFHQGWKFIHRSWVLFWITYSYWITCGLKITRGRVCEQGIGWCVGNDVGK